MLEECLKELEKYIGKNKIIKQGVSRYYINSDLILLDDDAVLPISLVEIIDTLYFSDYGGTLEEAELTDKEMEQLAKELSKFNIELSNGSLTMETSKETVYQDYNTFVTAISYIQMFCFLRGAMAKPIITDALR